MALEVMLFCYLICAITLVVMVLELKSCYFAIYTIWLFGSYC